MLGHRLRSTHAVEFPRSISSNGDQRNRCKVCLDDRCMQMHTRCSTGGQHNRRVPRGQADTERHERTRTLIYMYFQ